MNESSKSLLSKLASVEKIAKGSRTGRFLYRPVRYLTAMFYSKLLYRFTRKSFPVRVSTFFGNQMLVELPGSIDIYLLGCKTHDSEIRLCKFLIQHLKQGDTFADVGAHFGFFSLLAAQLTGPSGKVFAFEPSHNSFQVLQENTLGSKSVIAINKAVNEQHLGITEFHEFPARLSEFSSIFVDQLNKDEWISQATVRSIPTISLDGYFAESPVRPNIVKIDVEGAESLVVKGMRQIVQQSRPIVIMEYLNYPETGPQYREAARLLRKWGYEPRQMTPEGTLSPLPDIHKYFAQKNVHSDNIAFIPPRDPG